MTESISLSLSICLSSYRRPNCRLQITPSSVLAVYTRFGPRGHSLSLAYVESITAPKSLVARTAFSQGGLQRQSETPLPYQSTTTTLLASVFPTRTRSFLCQHFRTSRGGKKGTAGSTRSWLDDSVDLRATESSPDHQKIHQVASLSTVSTSRHSLSSTATSSVIVVSICHTEDAFVLGNSPRTKDPFNPRSR